MLRSHATPPAVPTRTSHNPQWSLHAYQDTARAQRATVAGPNPKIVAPKSKTPAMTLACLHVLLSVNCERISDVGLCLVSQRYCASLLIHPTLRRLLTRNHTHATRERGYAVIAVPDLTPLICALMTHLSLCCCTRVTSDERQAFEPHSLSHVQPRGFRSVTPCSRSTRGAARAAGGPGSSGGACFHRAHSCRAASIAASSAAGPSA